MIDTAQIVGAIDALEKGGAQVLVFVIPVDPTALAASGLSKETIEDRIQGVLIAELNDCLQFNEVHGKEFCDVVIPGVGKCQLYKDGHTTHRCGPVTWNGEIH